MIRAIHKIKQRDKVKKESKREILFSLKADRESIGSPPLVVLGGSNKLKSVCNGKRKECHHRRMILIDHCFFSSVLLGHVVLTCQDGFDCLANDIGHVFKVFIFPHEWQSYITGS
jgi:hypothetical protein